VAGQCLLLTRAATGEIRAYYNVCRHRGAELVREAGHYPFFRCPYHAWAYDLDGTCKGTPYFLESEFGAAERAVFDTSHAQEFDRADYPLLPVRTEVWGCFVFVNLDPDAAPLATQLGDLPERSRNYPLAELHLQHTVDYSINANWKLIAENYMEYYHIPWVHPNLNRVSHVHNHFWYQGEGCYTGMTTQPLDDDPECTLGKELAAMPGLDDAERVSARWYWVFPNISVSLLPDHLAVMLLIPEGPDRTRERFDFFFHPSAFEDPEFPSRSQSTYRMWDHVNVEDIVIVEAVQRGLRNRAYPGGRMCFHFEQNVHRFQNQVIDRMTGRATPPRHE
jgi:phenylpropionate dioxygenase-like ring-hydroxylating dioxygenase large terminal subunit